MSTASFIVEGSTGMAENKKRRLKDLCTKRVFTDFRIKVENEEIKCHRLVLASASEYFRSALMSDDGEELEGVTEMAMEGYSVAAVRLVVGNMYHNQMRISDFEQALEVLDVATRWKMEDELLKQVEQIVTTGLTTENCLKTRDHLLREDHQHLMAFVDQFIYQNFKEVTNSDSFKTANLHYVLDLFDSDDLQVEDEKDVYEAGQRWVESDRQGREKHMLAVVKTVRLGLMDLDEVTSIGFDLIRKYSQELDDYINENIEYLRNKKPRNQTDGNFNSMTKRSGQIVEKTLMCLGGKDDEGKRLKSVWTSDDVTTWRPEGDMLAERSSFSATICSGSVIVVGGVTSNKTITKSCEKYDIRSKQWTRIVDLPEPRRSHSASSLRRRQLYVAGGCHSSVISGNAINTVLTLRHVGDASAEWTAAPSMMQPRLNHVSCFINDALYVIGGCDDRNNLKSCEMLDLNSNKWRSVAPTHYTHQSAGACTDGVHHIYVAGGYDEQGPRYVEMYDVRTNQWSVLNAPLKAVTDSLTLVHHQDKIYAVGGEDDDDKRHDVVQVLDTTANSFASCQVIITRIKKLITNIDDTVVNNYCCTLSVFSNNNLYMNRKFCTFKSSNL